MNRPVYKWNRKLTRDEFRNSPWVHVLGLYGYSFGKYKSYVRFAPDLMNNLDSHKDFYEAYCNWYETFINTKLARHLGTVEDDHDQL